MVKDQWRKLTGTARERAFTVANVAQLDLVTDVWRALDKALSKGTGFQEFKKDVRQKLTDAWAGTVDNPPHRLETIFRTNLQQSYAAGRYEQATTPVVKALRPYWLYSSVLDSRTSPICRALSGTLRPADDPFWDGRHPPCHFSCRSALIALRQSQAEQRGGLTPVPPVMAQEGFGRLPGRKDFAPDQADYAPELWQAYERKAKARKPAAVESPVPFDKPGDVPPQSKLRAPKADKPRYPQPAPETPVHEAPRLPHLKLPSLLPKP